MRGTRITISIDTFVNPQWLSDTYSVQDVSDKCGFFLNKGAKLKMHYERKQQWDDVERFLDLLISCTKANIRKQLVISEMQFPDVHMVMTEVKAIKRGRSLYQNLAHKLLLMSLLFDKVGYDFHLMSPQQFSESQSTNTASLDDIEPSNVALFKPTPAKSEPENDDLSIGATFDDAMQLSNLTS